MSAVPQRENPGGTSGRSPIVPPPAAGGNPGTAKQPQDRGALAGFGPVCRSTRQGADLQPGDVCCAAVEVEGSPWPA